MLIKLSQILRDIFLPKYWRELEQVTAPNPYYVALPASNAWQTILTSTAWTLTETSDVKMTVSGTLQITAPAAGEIAWQMQMLQNGAAPTEVPLWRYYHYTSNTGNKYVPFSGTYTWKNLVPGAYTYTFQTCETLQTGKTRNVYATMQLDICRV